MAVDPDLRRLREHIDQAHVNLLMLLSDYCLRTHAIDKADVVFNHSIVMKRWPSGYNKGESPEVFQVANDTISRHFPRRT